MNCPTCNVELKMADRQGVEIDYCPQCRGVWLDRGELDKIIDRAMQEPSRYSSPPPQASSAPQSTAPQGNYRYDDDDDYRRYPGGHKKKHKSFLGELFDFD